MDYDIYFLLDEKSVKGCMRVREGEILLGPLFNIYSRLANSDLCKALLVKDFQHIRNFVAKDSSRGTIMWPFACDGSQRAVHTQCCW